MSLTTSLPRYPLAFLPTPLHPLPRLSSALANGLWRIAHGDPAHNEWGSRRTGDANRQHAIRNTQYAIHSTQYATTIWIKRDDQTGLAGGGNKTRKLEFLIADALAQGADTILTVGAVQSNHCRQTAAAAARAGLACHLVLGGVPPSAVNGNLLLDELLGAELHWVPREKRLARLAELTDELRAQGRRPYPITYGGSDPVGASGYVLALEELRDQVTALNLEPDAIVFPSSSGGTQAGLVAGAWLLGWDVPIVGISVDEPRGVLQAGVADLATRTAAHLGRPHTFAADDILVVDGYLGGGYGVLGDLEREAITLLARTEGILLDPVYTGRAFGGLLEMMHAGKGPIGPDARNIIFWHTGGWPALFAYASELAH